MITPGEFVDEYLEMHQAAPVTLSVAGVLTRLAGTCDAPMPMSRAHICGKRSFCEGVSDLKAP
jgi:hypothetical protein